MFDETRGGYGAAVTSSTERQATRYLVHLMSHADWQAVQRSRGAEYSELRPPSLSEVGFVHLSTPQQVHLPANRFYEDERDLVALIVDTALIDDEIRWEPGTSDDPADMRFPHLYGPLPLTAVVEETSYPRGADGRFPPFGEGRASR